MSHKSAETIKKIDGKPYKISKKSPAQSGKGNGDGSDRFNMISEAAYYRALGRGFDGGDPVDDWLRAESEIDCMPHNWEEHDSQAGHA